MMAVGDVSGLDRAWSANRSERPWASDERRAGPPSIAGRFRTRPLRLARTHHLGGLGLRQRPAGHEPLGGRGFVKSDEAWPPSALAAFQSTRSRASQDFFFFGRPRGRGGASGPASSLAFRAAMSRRDFF